MRSLVRERAALLSFLIILLIGLIGCRSNKNSGFKNSLKPLSLKQDLRISANNPKVLIGGFDNLSVDGSGHIYATDRRQDVIHIFNKDGSYLDSLGRRGKGPGEFTTLVHSFLRGDTLYAMDVGYFPPRLSMFDTESRSFLRTWDLPTITRKQGVFIFPTELFPVSHNRFEIMYREGYSFNMKQKLEKGTLILTKSGVSAISDTLGQFPPNHELVYRTSRLIREFNSPFLPKTILSAGPDGTFYTAFTDSMHITGYNESGGVIKDFRADYTPPELTTSQLDSIRNKLDKKGSVEFNQALSQISVPRRWPAIKNLLVDDNNMCWVELAGPVKPYRTWWVFNTDGEPEWKFKLPKNIQLFVVKKGEVYGVETVKGGLPAIVRYKINKVEMRNG